MNSEKVAELAMLRVSRIFGVPVERITEKDMFDVDLKASFISDFRRNEYDALDDDVRDVSDRSILKQLETGLLTIHSVGDYCTHMVSCHERKPDEVARVLCR